MGNDVEMYLEKVFKKTNPEKYIEILEQDREDFAKEIVELNQKIDKAIEELDKYINSCEIEAEHTLNNEKCLRSVNHSKKVKNILQGSEK